MKCTPASTMTAASVFIASRASVGRSDRAAERQLAAAEGALEHDFAAESVELGGAAAGFGRDRAGLLDQALLVDQAAEVLLVQRPAGQRLDRALQLQQGEFFGHQFEHDRTVF